MASYSKSTIDAIKAIPVLDLFPGAEKKGSFYYCRCPQCGGDGWKKSKWKGLTIDPSKNRADCYNCNGIRNKGIYNTYASIHNLDRKKDFIRIIEGIADETGTPIEKENQTRKSEFDGRPIPGSFAAKQLKESGLTPEDVTAEVVEGDKIIRIPVFQRGSLNVSSGVIDPMQDEMVILYYDLEGRRKKYLPKGRLSKERPYSRVRWSNPEAKLDNDGKPIKYQTPVGASAEIYIPQKIRDAYKSKLQFDTLIVQEGEKKAEKACKHGIMSIGIQGIFNIGTKQTGLPREIQYIAQTCGVKNIVLLFDSDWQDLSRNLENDKDIDARPYTFAKAAMKFKTYVKTLHQIGIHVDIWFGHINRNNANAKGIDDLLAGPLEGQEERLKTDIDNVLGSIKGEGELVSIYKISTLSEWQIKDFWSLNSKEQFFEIHKDRILELDSFKFGNVFYNVVDGEIRQSNEFGSGKEFWEIIYKTTKDGEQERQVRIHIKNAKSFLESNGFCSHVDEEGNNTFVRVERGIISKVRLPEIHRFIYNYVTKASKDDDVHEYFLSSMENKFSQGKLNLLDPLTTNAGIPDQYKQWFYYKNSQVGITGENISIEPLIGPVWDQNLIKRNFARVKIFESVSQKNDGSFEISLTPDGEDCEFLTFLKNTSSFLDNTDKEIFDPLHLVNKLTCIGYLLRTYRSHSEKKVVIAADTKISEVGDSNGRSGKSLVGIALSKMMEQIVVDGRSMKDSDEFIFTEVRNTTSNIFMDDIKVNFELGHIYAAITNDLTVNVKGGKRFTIPFEVAPKIYITTNHSIRSEGDSTEDRTIYMGFSSHYSIDNSPVMEFGHEFFTEWDERQWILFDNLMVECVHLYMKSIKEGWTKVGCGAVPPPMDIINLRRERQNMGEAFFQWAEAYFSSDGDNINNRIFRRDMYQDFINANRQVSKYVTPTNFKNRLKSYCKYKKLHLNPHKKNEKDGTDFNDWILNHDPAREVFFGAEEKTAGKEYLTVADKNFFTGDKTQKGKSILQQILGSPGSDESELPY